MAASDDRRLDIAGIGSMVVDRMHRVPRIGGADEKVLLADIEGAGPVRRMVGGVVLNHLGWAAVLGARTAIFGRQGADEDGRFLRDAMKRLGIEPDLQLLADESTSLAEIFVDARGDRVIYMSPGATAATRPEHVRQHHAGTIERAAWVTSEVSQLRLETVRQVLDLARAAHASTAVDLDVPPSIALVGLGSRAELEAVLAAADLLKPSKSAARDLVGAGNALDQARQLRRRFGNEVVIVTDGAAGCAATSDEFEDVVPGFPAAVVDTTGAGDAFLGGLLAARARGASWSESARVANAAGAVCCEKLGAFPDDPVEARRRIEALLA